MFVPITPQNIPKLRVRTWNTQGWKWVSFFERPPIARCELLVFWRVIWEDATYVPGSKLVVIVGDGHPNFRNRSGPRMMWYDGYINAYYKVDIGWWSSLPWENNCSLDPSTLTWTENPNPKWKSLYGGMTQFDLDIFQMGWNNQLESQAQNENPVALPQELNRILCDRLEVRNQRQVIQFVTFCWRSLNHLKGLGHLPTPKNVAKTCPISIQMYTMICELTSFSQIYFEFLSKKNRQTLCMETFVDSQLPWGSHIS